MKDDFIIYGQDYTEKAFTESLEYHGEWMGDEFVTVTVHSPEPVDFQIGDYLEYRGENFSILDDPNIIKKARSGSYQEGFTYENIKLYPESARMKHIAFNDYVLPDPDAPANKIPYSSLNIFSFFAASVEDLADRIQANLDRMEPDMWAVFTPNHSRVLQRVPSEISKWNNYYDGSYEVQGKTDVNVTVSGLSCWEALKLAYTSFDVSYYITGRIIVIGGTPVSTEHDFRYGKGLGLYEIERTTDESQDVVTKLYCYGSEKNIPYGYYANLGKRIRFQIKTKTEREYIARNPRLLLWVEVPYQDVKKAFNDQGMFEVELECNGNKATFRGWGDTYTYGDEKDDDTLDHETVYLNFYTHQDDFDGAAFYNSVSVGSYVYVTRGMNINKLSSDFVVIPQTYDYDAALSVNRLMLPGYPEQSLFDWVRTNGGTVLDSEKGIVGWKSWSFYASKDKKDPWIMSLKKDREGVREGTANFDESSGNEIFPTIEGTGLDIVSWAEQMDDNGYLGDDPKESEKIFMMQPSTISSYEIDWNDTDGEEVSISMKDGSCVGREFKMKKAQRNEDTKLWELTLERYFDSSIGRYFPYNANASGDRSLYQVMGTGNSHGTRQGNHFVALGIKLPSSYVQLAAEKLLEESLKELKKIDHHRHTYVPKVDEIYMKRQDDFIRNEYRPGYPQTKDYGTVSLHDTLRAGMQIEMSDDDLGLDHYKPYIDVLTIKEDGNNGIPTYDLVMREEKELTLQERLQSQIEGGVKEYVNLTNKGTSVYGEYISKAYEDETEYLVSFLGGLMVDGSLKSPQYKEGEWEMVKDEESGLLTKVHTGEGLGVYRDDKGGWHIELDEATIRKMLRTKELSSLKAFFGSEDYYNPEESVLAVQGNAEFSHHLSSTEFQSGFIGGKGWAIKRVEFTNALGEPETRYTLEIDNITVRNTLRVYEMIISQLRGENDNYIFAAMAEVHHYDPETGKVWLSTEGGKIYMPFRPGDYIMVQRYQPGNTAASGGDGYITKSYELVIIDCNAGGEVDENGDRLDWVLFKNFTTQMVDDSTDPRHDDPDYDGTYYTEEEIDHQVDPVMMTPEQLIKKGDTFCRIDNESDPERKGIIGITSVGPSTPYIDVMYGRKTDPEDFLKGRIGNLEGIKTKEFGWLQGFGAYLINLYGVGKFFNAQTGEAMESRIEATNERLRSVYREKGYDINENDNKVKNGFFQNGLDYWTPCDTDGEPLSAPAEMETINEEYDEHGKLISADWQMTHSDGKEAYVIETGGDPMLLNGLQLEVQKTTQVELATVEGVQVLHLNNAGVIQDYDDMTPNTAHKKLTMNDDEFDDPDTPKPEYEKETRGYWEDVIRGEIAEAHPTWNTRQIEDELSQETYQQRIENSINSWIVTNATREATLTAMEDENDKLYVGVRILPLTGGDLCIGFLEADEYGNVDTPDLTNSFTLQFIQDTKWNVEQRNDYPEAQDEWYFPVVTDETRKQGRFLISYTGECYIRFVVLQNNPIDEDEHEYKTIFEQNSRRILMQASKDQQEQASIVLQYDAIAQMVTDDRDNAETQLAKILGITINADGTYNFPADWVNTIGNYNYGSFNIQTKNRLDTLFAKWDDKGNLIGYSHHTQSADYIRNVIASTQYTSYPQWVKTCLGLVNSINTFYDAWKTAAANGGLSGSSVTALKSQWETISNLYDSCCATLRDLTADDIKGYELAVGIFLSEHTWQTAANIDIEMNRFTDGEAVDKDNYEYKELNFTDIPDLVEAMKQFIDAIVSQCTDNNLAANVAAVTAGFTQYQTDLDAATAGTYTGQVDFLNWVNDTSQSYMKVLAALKDSTGQLIDYSIVTQTAQQFATTVARFEEENIELAVIGNWEAKDVRSSSIAGKTFDEIKVDPNSTILYKYLVPVTKYASVVLNDGYKVKFVYFDSTKKVCTGNLNNSGWKSVAKEGNKVIDTNISVKTSGGDLPSSMRYVAIILKKDSGSISTDNVADSGIMLTDNKIASASYVEQTADGIRSTVTANKTAADTAIETINNTLSPLSQWKTDKEDDYDNAATWVSQAPTNLSAIAGKFDSEGNPTVASGLVVATGSGNNSFASLFSTAVDGEMTADGKLSVYVQKNKTTGLIESGISLSADQLDFTAQNITWQLGNSWKIQNNNNDILYFDANGNLQIAGQVTAQQTDLSISSTGKLSVHGNFILDNATKIQWKDTDGTARSMLTLDSAKNTDDSVNNHFIVGEAMASLGLTTVIRGSKIAFQSGSSANENASLDANGVFAVTKLQIGGVNGATLQWVEGKGLQVNKTFYSTLGVAALGSGSSSGGGGGDITITEFGVLNASAKTVRLTISGQTKDANLSSLFNGYALSSVLGSMAYETASDYPLVSDIGRLKITINDTSQTWNPLTSGTSELRFAVDGGGDLSNYWSKGDFSLKSYTSKQSLGWVGTTEDAKKVVTSNALAFWNGLYDSTVESGKTHSNLSYCSKGAFGDLAVKNKLSYTLIEGGTSSQFVKADGSVDSNTYKTVTLNDTAANAEGYELLTLGNSTKLNVANNKYGAIRLYKRKDSTKPNATVYYGQIEVSQDLTANRTYTLPDAGGTIATTGNVVTLADAQTISGAKTFNADLTIKGHIKAGSNSTYEIGGSGTWWKNIYVTNVLTETINNTAKAITIQSGSYNLQLGGSSNYIGIGAAADNTYKLKVSGTSYFTDKVCIGGTTTSTSYKLYVSGKSYFTDNVYIGKSDVYLTYKTLTPTTGTTLNFLDVHAAGLYLNGSPYSGSDMRKKNVEKNLNFGVEEVARAPIFDFTWRNGSDKLVHVGSSAQYWQPLLPHAVLDFYDDGLALDYGATALAAAVMTARKVVDHEERIKALEAENKQLREEIVKLKAV